MGACFSYQINTEKMLTNLSIWIANLNSYVNTSNRILNENYSQNEHELKDAGSLFHMYHRNHKNIPQAHELMLINSKQRPIIT